MSSAFKKKYLGRLYHIQHRFYTFSSVPCQLHQSDINASILIDLDNTVVMAFRDFAISTVRAAQRSGAAQMFATGLCSDITYDRELALARWRAGGGRRKQPRGPFTRRAVRDPAELHRDIKTLGAPVPKELTHAMGIPNLPFSEIKHFRHFYAHRCEDTATKLRRNIPTFLATRYTHPDDFVRGRDLATGVNVFDRWWAGVFNFLNVML